MSYAPSTRAVIVSRVIQEKVPIFSKFLASLPVWSFNPIQGTHTRFSIQDVEWGCCPLWSLTALLYCCTSYLSTPISVCADAFFAPSAFGGQQLATAKTPTSTTGVSMKIFDWKRRENPDGIGEMCEAEDYRHRMLRTQDARLWITLGCPAVLILRH